MGRPRGRLTPGVQEPEVRVEWVRAEPSPLQALAWKRLWQLLLQGGPATTVPNEPPPDVADAGGARAYADDQA
jgi:hypothetical protein